ncbi:hypothetical protein [Mycobacterium avium]|uniref:hypothetical protein n=1 Tax=Mycobacterium avium TaxID=1764 RepID=UPI0007A0B00D|nr:hypothetical protein [Mycobacterium avium]
MSAYVVHAEHINVLLWAGRYGFRRPCGNLTWYYDNPTRVNQLTDDNLDQVGQMLVDANTASVNYCYFNNRCLLVSECESTFPSGSLALR